MSRIATILPGCFAGDDSADLPPMSSRGRAARLVVGLGFLALAGFIGSRSDLGWLVQVAAVIPAWFGITHLVASVTGYQGCPELGAIPSLVLKRPIATNCTVWRWMDKAIGADRVDSTCVCGCSKQSAGTDDAPDR
jgi:hypothetical protein